MLVNIFSYTFNVSSLIITYVRRRDPLTPNYKEGKNVSCQLTRWCKVGSTLTCLLWLEKILTRSDCPALLFSEDHGIWLIHFITDGYVLVNQLMSGLRYTVFIYLVLLLHTTNCNRLGTHNKLSIFVVILRKNFNEFKIFMGICST